MHQSVSVILLILGSEVETGDETVAYGNERYPLFCYWKLGYGKLSPFPSSKCRNEKMSKALWRAE